MRIREMSVRKRVIIAIAAIAVIHALFVSVGIWWATRPRFDEAAWREAVEILKADVGVAAVEKGTFRIPRIEVRPPYTAVVNPAKVYMLIDGQGATIFFDDSPTERVSPDSEARFWTARITRKKAIFIWDTLEYLEHLGVSSGPGSATGGSGQRYGVEGRLSEHLVRTYSRVVADRLRRDSDIRWKTGESDLSRAVMEAFRRCVPPRTETELNCASSAMDRIVWTANAETIGVLVKALSKVKMRMRIAELPVLDRLSPLGTGKQYLGVMAPRLSDAITLARSLEAKTEEERFSKAWKAAFDLGLSYKVRRKVMFFMMHQRPREFAGLYLANERALSASEKQDLLLFYESNFGTNSCIAEVAISDVSPAIRAVGYCEMYRMTKDKAYIEKLQQLFHPTPASGVEPIFVARLLSRLYAELRGPDDIPDALEEHFEEAQHFAVDTARMRGNRKDLDFLLSIVIDRGTTAFLPHEADESLLREHAAKALSGCTDETVIRALADYVESAPDEERVVRNAAVGTLGASGSTMALEVLERLCGRWEAGTLEREPSGQPPSAPHISRPGELPTEIAAANALVEAKVRCAASPVDFALGLSAKDARVVEFDLPRILAASYTLEELLGMLAEAKYSTLFGDIYAAIEEKR